MALLKDTLITGNLRVTDTTLTDTLQADTIKVNQSSTSDTKTAGTSGQVLMTNGESAYWGTVASSDVNVTQTATTTSANYEVLLSGTADNTTRTEGARKNSNLTFNPSTGNLQTTQLNGVAVGSSPKFTDTTYSSKTAASGGTDVSLVTTGEKYTWNNKGTGTITKVGNTSSGAVTVSSANNTASFGSAVTVGSVGGVDLKFTMPSNPNTNTTYTFAEGSTDGAFSVTPSGGSATPVSVHGVVTSSNITNYTGNAKLFHGICNTAAATVAKVVECEDFKSTDLVRGAAILVTFDVVNTGAVASLTMNVNSTGAFPIKKNYNASVGNLTSAGEIRASTYLCTFYDKDDYKYWVISGLNFNSTYALGRADYERRYIHSASTPLYRYKICGIDSTGKLVPLTITNQTSATIVSKTPTDVGFSISRGLFYYSSTTNITSISTPTAAQTLYYDVSTTVAPYTFNETIATYSDIFLKGTVNGDTFTLDTTSNTSWYVQVKHGVAEATYNSVFTTGSYYMYVGSSYSTNNYFRLAHENPVFYFDGEKLNNIPVSNLLNGTSTQFVKGDGSFDSNSYLPENQAILSRMQDDATHRTVTDTDKTNWNNKQSTLISGSNIKTINNTSILGSGNISIPSGKSAYEIWLDAGNTGTESDFLESLKGNSGYSGAAGELQVVNDLTTGGATAALSAEMGKTLADMINAPINIDLSSITVNTGWAIPTSTGKWASSSSYKYILVPVENYYKIIVYTSSSGSSALAWLKSNASPVSGGTPDYASETTIWTQTAGTTETYEVPSDAKYLYIYVASRYPDKIIGINYNTETTSDSNVYVNSSENDFEIVDVNKNPIVVFNDGHIKTLNFDSSKLEKLPYVRRNFFSYNVNCNNFLTTNFTASSINYYDPIALYEDNAILYLPASYSNQGPKTKLIIYCKEGSTYMTEDHDSILTNPEVTRYFLYQGYAILAADGVPDGWKEALKIGERAVGNYVAVQSTLRAFEYVKNNYNIDCDNVFIFGYSQGGMYAENVIDNTDLPIRAAVLLSPALSMRYHQWDAPTSQTIDGTSYTKGARLNIARIFNFPEVTTNAQLLALEYDPDKVCGYDPWARNVDNPYTDFVKGTSVGTELWGLPTGASLDSITMKKYTKCPTKIWVAENDNVLGVDITKVFVKAIRNTGQVADLQLFSTGEHHIQNYQTAIRTFVENGENVSLLPLYLDMAAWYYNFGGLELK